MESKHSGNSASVGRATEDRGEHLPTDSLDALRGVAAAYVVLFHTRLLLLVGEASAAVGGAHGITTQLLSLATALTRHGGAAVLAFFLISGYAIHYRQAYRTVSGEPRLIDWKSYAWHRARRLYPPLLLALLLTLVLDAVGTRVNPAFYAGAVPQETLVVVPQADTWQSLVATLLFLQGVVTPIFGTDGPLWSLAYEGLFYAAYPLVLLVDRQMGPVKSLALFVGIGAAAFLTIGLGVHATLLQVIAYWPAWVAGTFIANIRAGRVRIEGRWWLPALATPLALVGLVPIRNLGSNQDQINILSSAMWVVAFVGPLAWLVAARHTLPTRTRVLWVLRPLKGLGAMSYSLYVVHMPVLALFSAVWLARNPTLPFAPWLAVTGLAAAAVTSAVVYLLAERPVLKARRLSSAHPRETRKGRSASAVQGNA